jgi:ArsR family transcriptional regulator
MNMRETLFIAKAMADENRIRTLMALRGRVLCVCQIVELLALAPSTVSKHISILRQAGLVEARKEGRWVNYSLPGDDAPAAAGEVIAWLDRSLQGDAVLAADEARLKEILKIDREQLCRLREKS